MLPFSLSPSLLATLSNKIKFLEIFRTNDRGTKSERQIFNQLVHFPLPKLLLQPTLAMPKIRASSLSMSIWVSQQNGRHPSTCSGMNCFTNALARMQVRGRVSKTRLGPEIRFESIPSRVILLHNQPCPRHHVFSPVLYNSCFSFNYFFLFSHFFRSSPSATNPITLHASFI